MNESDGPASTGVKKCFVVSAFGADADEQRRTKQVLHHLVKKVLSPLGYEVVRADEIDEEGLITNQIIEHLLNDDLVVADLTGSNPNVFYEVAVRHAANKPIVHLITVGETIPFDVAHMRAVTYALDDPDSLEEAQNDLERKVRTIEDGDGKASPNPVTVGRDVAILRDSDAPELREAGDILGALNELRDQIRSLERRIEQRPVSALREVPLSAPTIRKVLPADVAHAVEDVIERELKTSSEIPAKMIFALYRRDNIDTAGLADLTPASSSSVSRYLKQLQARRMVWRRPDGAWQLTDKFRSYLIDSAAS